MVEQKTKLNIANALSISRIFLAPIFMILIFQERILEGFIILLIAGLTDFLDGWIARSLHIQTKFGKMIDPLADKIVMFFAILTLLIKLNFPLWVGLIIISRDLLLLMGSLLFMFKHKRKVLIPNFLGKATTFMQMITVLGFMLQINVVLKDTLITLTVLLTILSAIVYFTKSYKFLFKTIAINVPNRITIARILLIPIFIGVLMSSISFRREIAALLFILLALSDAVDGYIARKKKQITDFGKLIDPLADKLLVSSALIFLIGKGIDPWMVFIILAREFAVMGLRTIAIAKHKVIEAKFSGKLKTIVQIVAITAVLVNFSYSWHLMVVAVLVTLYSGIEYFYINRDLYSQLVLKN